MTEVREVKAKPLGFFRIHRFGGRDPVVHTDEAGKIHHLVDEYTCKNCGFRGLAVKDEEPQLPFWNCPQGKIFRPIFR